MGILFGISYAIIVSFGKIILKKSLTDFKPSVSFFWESVFGLIIWLPTSALFGINLKDVIAIIPVVILSAILSEAYIFYIYTKGDISVIGTIFPSYSIFTILFASIILHEKLTQIELIAVALTITGILLISIPRKGIKIIDNLSPVLWALSGAIAVGFADSVGKSAINQTSSYTFLFTLGIVQIPVALGFLYLEKEKLSDTIFAFKNLGKYKQPFISAFLIALAQLFFWLSFEGVPASIASPISSTNAMFTAILAFVLLKEDMSKIKVIGIILVISGIIGISM
jgi:transporter family protein